MNRSCAEVIIKGGPGLHDRFDSGSIEEPTLIDLERGVAKVKHWPWSERFRLAGIEDTHGGTATT